MLRQISRIFFGGKHIDSSYNSPSSYGAPPPSYGPPPAYAPQPPQFNPGKTCFQSIIVTMDQLLANN